MAGEVKMPMMLTQRLADDIKKCGFDLDIKVDCSHAIHVKTVRSDRPNNHIITKPIELDVQMRANSNLEKGLGIMQSARTTSDLFVFYSKLVPLLGKGGSPAGVFASQSRDIKVEFANFDATIFDVNTTIAPIANAVRACNAANVLTFNGLPDFVRRSMGMYRRIAANSFTLVGGPEPGPRVAIP